MWILVLFGFLIGTLTSLTNAHAVRGRPTLKYNREHISARSFRELKVNSKVNSKIKLYNSKVNLKANCELLSMITNSERSSKANLLCVNTTNFCIASNHCHWYLIISHVKTPMLYNNTDAILDTSSLQTAHVRDINQIKEGLRIFFIASVGILIIIFNAMSFAFLDCLCCIKRLSNSMCLIVSFVPLYTIRSMLSEGDVHVFVENDKCDKCSNSLQLSIRIYHHKKESLKEFSGNFSLNLE